MAEVASDPEAVLKLRRIEVTFSSGIEFVLFRFCLAFSFSPWHLQDCFRSATLRAV